MRHGVLKLPNTLVYKRMYAFQLVRDYIVTFPFSLFPFIVYSVYTCVFYTGSCKISTQPRVVQACLFEMLSKSLRANINDDNDYCYGQLI